MAELTRDALRNMGRYIAGVAGAGLRGELPRGRGRHPLQRFGAGRAQAGRDGRRAQRPRPLRRPLVRARDAGHLPGHRPLAGALLPQPAGPRPDPRAEEPGRRPSRRRSRHLRRAALALPRPAARPGGGVGRLRTGRDRLLSACCPTTRSAATSSWAVK